MAARWEGLLLVIKIWTGRIKLIEGRNDVQTVFGIWIDVLSSFDIVDVFTASLFLSVIHFSEQHRSFLAVFLPINFVTESGNSAIDLAFSPIVTNDADHFFCIRF